MKAFYVTFGQIHVHAWSGRTLDRNTVGVIHAHNYEGAMEQARECFGEEFANVYDKLPNMRFYPGGLVKLT